MMGVSHPLIPVRGGSAKRDGDAKRTSDTQRSGNAQCRGNAQRGVAAAAVMLLAILLIECVAFNLPFWRTLGASTDSASVANALGAGLMRRTDGMLTVVDPTRAYMDVKADGTSRYARVDASQPSVIAAAADNATTNPKLRTAFTLRADGDGHVGHMQMVSTGTARSLYLHVDAQRTIRVWVVEAKGTVVPLDAVRANVKVPFHVEPLRLAGMAAIALLVAAWRPGSRLWSIRLDPASGRQRLTLALLLTPAAIYTAWSIVMHIRGAWPLVFHTPGSYTYDFDQYAHAADALLHGHAWLDLPVPDEFAAASNPYDPAVRDRLLAAGVTPIYWDYAFLDGHWYSYFGVLPTLLLFAPYQAIASALAGRPLMLSTGAAMLALLFGVLVFGVLLTIRLVHRLAPHASLAATSMAVATLLLGSNAGYLWFRTNFYSVPFAASMLLTFLGLWLWLGAERTAKDGGIAQWHLWRANDRCETALSLPHLAAGALCIAANAGCRPTFATAALLGIPLFWRHIRALFADLAARRMSYRHACVPIAAVLAPAALVVMPLLAYNALRFGSPFDFGSDYQITVTDMTRFRQPLANLPATIGYYLLLPLRVTDSFPWLGVNPTPLTTWGFAEPLVGGLFILFPLLLPAVALAAPRLRRRIAAPTRHMLVAALALAAALLLFDAYAAGLGWRYMTDFGWLIALAAMPAIIALGDGAERVGDSRHALMPADTTFGAHPQGSRLRRMLGRSVLMILLAATLIIGFLSAFVIGRQDAMIGNDPQLFFSVRSWFTL